MKTPVVLVGLMGSGKTSLGPLLARRLGLDWVDLDRVLQRRWGPIARQFARDGEAAFRRREAAALLREGRPGRVLSTGGGVVLAPANRAWLKRQQTVYLQVPVAVLERRLSGAEKARRPLLQGRPLAATLRAMARDRGPLYRACARWTLRAGNASPERLCERLVARLRPFSLS